MKTMKRVAVGLLALGMTYTMTACGSKEPAVTEQTGTELTGTEQIVTEQTATEQVVTYKGELEESGLKATDTITFSAKDDIIEKMTEVIEFDISSFDDSVKEQLISVYDELAGQYNEIDGVNCAMTTGDNSITLNIDVDTTGNAVKELTDKGLLDMSGGDGSGKISLEASGASLEANGYEKVE